MIMPGVQYGEQQIWAHCTVNKVIYFMYKKKYNKTIIPIKHYLLLLDKYTNQVHELKQIV